jgi:hypothetical protein
MREGDLTGPFGGLVVVVEPHTVLEPRTAKGRATTRLMRFNDPDRIEERELLIASGWIQGPIA